MSTTASPSSWSHGAESDRSADCTPWKGPGGHQTPNSSFATAKTCSPPEITSVEACTITSHGQAAQTRSAACSCSPTARADGASPAYGGSAPTPNGAVLDEYHCPPASWSSAGPGIPNGAPFSPPPVARYEEGRGDKEEEDASDSTSLVALSPSHSTPTSGSTAASDTGPGAIVISNSTRHSAYSPLAHHAVPGCASSVCPADFGEKRPDGWTIPHIDKTLPQPAAQRNDADVDAHNVAHPLSPSAFHTAYAPLPSLGDLTTSSSGSSIPALALNSPTTPSVSASSTLSSLPLTPTSPARPGEHDAVGTLIPTTELIETRLAKAGSFRPRSSSLRTSPPIVAWLDHASEDASMEHEGEQKGPLVEYSLPSPIYEVEMDWSPEAKEADLGQLQMGAPHDEALADVEPLDAALPPPPTPRLSAALLPSLESSPVVLPMSAPILPSIEQVLDDIADNTLGLAGLVTPRPVRMIHKAVEVEDVDPMNQRSKAIGLLRARAAERRGFMKALEQFAFTMESSEPGGAKPRTIAGAMAARRRHALGVWHQVERAVFGFSHRSRATTWRSQDWRHSDLEEIAALKAERYRPTLLPVPQDSTPNTKLDPTPERATEPETPRYTAAQKGKWKAVNIESPPRVSPPEAEVTTPPEYTGGTGLHRVNKAPAAFNTLLGYDTPKGNPTLRMRDSTPHERVSVLRATAVHVDPRHHDEDDMALDEDAYGNCETSVLTSTVSGQCVQTVLLKSKGSSGPTEGLAGAAELQVEVHDDQANGGHYSANSPSISVTPPGDETDAIPGVETQLEEISMEIMQLDWLEDAPSDETSSSSRQEGLQRLGDLRKQYDELETHLARLLYEKKHGSGSDAQCPTRTGSVGMERQTPLHSRQGTPPEQIVEGGTSWWTATAITTSTDKPASRPRSFLNMISDGVKSIAAAVTASADSPTHADEAFPTRNSSTPRRSKGLPSMDEVLSSGRTHSTPRRKEVAYAVRKRKSTPFRDNSLLEDAGIGLGIASPRAITYSEPLTVPHRRTRRRPSHPDIYSPTSIPDTLSLPAHIPVERSQLLFTPRDDVDGPSLVITASTPPLLPTYPKGDKRDTDLETECESLACDMAESLLSQGENAPKVKLLAAAFEPAFKLPPSPSTKNLSGDRPAPDTEDQEESPQRPGSAGKHGSGARAPKAFGARESPATPAPSTGGRKYTIRPSRPAPPPPVSAGSRRFWKDHSSEPDGAGPFEALGTGNRVGWKSWTPEDGDLGYTYPPTAPSARANVLSRLAGDGSDTKLKTELELETSEDELMDLDLDLDEVELISRWSDDEEIVVL